MYDEETNDVYLLVLSKGFLKDQKTLAQRSREISGEYVSERRIPLGNLKRFCMID